DLARWCIEHLGSPPVEELFGSGQLSAVRGLRLSDGRAVVVEIRPSAPRIAACVEVQRRLFRAGYPCLQPLTGVTSFGRHVASAEACVPEGALLPAGNRATAYATAFAELIRLAPPPVRDAHARPAADLGRLESPRRRIVAAPGGERRSRPQ